MDKTNKYDQVVPQIESLIRGIDNFVGALANVTAALKEAFGYYL